MRFQDKNTIFELKIESYEFPDNLNEEFDSNWLIAKFGVKEQSKSWKMIDKVTFLAWEIKELPIWLIEIAENREKTKIFGDLLEPCLQLTKTKKTDEYVHLKIELFWGMIEKNWKGPKKLVLNIEIKKFKKQIKSLEKELKQFPERALKNKLN